MRSQHIFTPFKSRIPVIMAVAEGISGVVSWAVRLRKILQNHPRYNILLLQCGGATSSPLFDFHAPYFENAKDYISRNSPCILIPNYIMDVFSIAVELISQEKDIRCLGICHADSQAEYYNPLVWFEPIIAQFIGVSPESAKNLTKQISFRSNDISILPCGVFVPNQLKRNYQTSPIRIAYAGRIVQLQKRVFDLIKLGKYLNQKGVNFRLDIIGDGPDLSLFKQSLVNNCLSENFHLLGRMPLETVAKSWHKYDVCVQVSEFEGTSVSMLEAMAEGAVPVVTTASSGIDGVIKNGKNGFIVPIGAMDDLAKQIQKLASHPQMLSSVGTNAYETAKQFSIHTYAKSFTIILDRIIETSPRKWLNESFKPQIHIESMGFL